MSQEKRVKDFGEGERGRGGPKRRKRPAWQKGIIYQVYPRSFADSTGDGIGDLKGIASKSDYFVDIGVETIWISPIYESPMKDFGYDISNFEKIDPIFGTMEDFDNLLAEMHSKDIKVVLDFVPNHSSDQHEWFQKSLQNDTKYKDYYVWKHALGFNETGDPIPPNNWLSNFRYSAWEWSDERQQFYLHQFLKEQPDLNYRNPDVVQEMNDVLRFWLDKGVDGVRVDALKFLLEVEDVYGADEPVAVDSGVTDPTQYGYLNHTYTVNQPGTFEVTAGWRKIMDEYPDKVMMVEVYDDDVTEVMKYYGNETNPLADFPFNFFLLSNLPDRNSVSGISLKANVELWLQNMPLGKWANWVFGNHDNGRVATRLGADLVDALNMYNLLLPGTPVTYYGEEIGMEDTYISYEDTQDPSGCTYGPDHYQEHSRDPERTPMQWDDTSLAGFTKGNTTWLPVNDNYLTLNVKAQNESGQSHLKVYKQISQLRKVITFQQGLMEFQIATEEVVAFVRFLENEDSYIVVVNTLVEETTADLTIGSVELPATATVVIRSSNDTRPETEIGSTVNLAQVVLQGGEGMVLQVSQ